MKCVVQILEQFCMMSCQEVSREKIRIYFSRNVTVPFEDNWCKCPNLAKHVFLVST